MHTKATKFAWVSGCRSYGYVLHVAQDPRVELMQHLNQTAFTNFRAAQHIANAIREFAEQPTLKYPPSRKA